MTDHKLLVPAYKLTFSQDASAAGGAAGAVASVAAPVVSGGKVLDTTSEPKASTVVELRVALDMDTPADSLTLVMGQVGHFRPARGDLVKVELGYADDNRGLFQVLTANLVVIEPGLIQRRLVGHSAAARLLAATSGQHYVGKSAGAIVKDLAAVAGVPVDTAEDGIRFPAYIVDGRRSVYQHMKDIADLCGFDLYIKPDGKLVFEKFVGGKTVHVFEYGRDIVALELIRQAPAADKIEAWGESPGASQGENSWAWLTKDFSPHLGRAGDGNRTFLLEKPALRSAAAANKAANALLVTLKRQATRGRLLLTGQPQVKLGDALHIKSAPEAELNASYQVRAVTHRITKSGGFVTVVDFRSLES